MATEVLDKLPTARKPPNSPLRMLAGPWRLTPDSGRYRGRLALPPPLLRRAPRHSRAGQDAFLDTDKPENVLLYGKVGFAVVNEAEVLGTRNWWMRRPTRRDWGEPERIG